MFRNVMLHTVPMFAKETKSERENNLFLNIKELIRVLTQNYLLVGNSEKLENFFLYVAKNQQRILISYWNFMVSLDF